ncbi:MAG: hypothetical protein Q9228_007465 [Teloschistes exilis]
MSRSALVSQFFLPLEAVSLGRFVASFEEPHQKYHDPMDKVHTDTMEKVQIQYESSNRNIIDRNSTSHLASFLSSSFSKRLSASVYVEAGQAKTYHLNNPGQWFDSAVQLQETRKWIEKTIDEGEDIYLIVAYQTLQDARITEYIGTQSSMGGNAVIPVSTALAASGIAVPFSSLVDPELEGFRGGAEDQQRRFIAPGEQVFAAQYRKVRSRWFAKNTVDKMTLEKKTIWEKYDRPRNLQSKAEDMIEVELGDDVVFEGDCYEWATGSGGGFILSTPG